MKEKCIIYKVCKKKGHRRHSAVADGAWCVYYAKGKKARGFRGTPLLCFSNEEDARAWFNDMSWCGLGEVWKVSATNVRAAPKWLPDDCVSPVLSAWELFWNDLREFLRKFTPEWETPRGSLIADTVTLIERVWPE